MVLDKWLKPEIKGKFPDYIAEKVYLSNQAALAAILVVTIPISIISFIHFKPLIYIPLFGVLVAIFSIVLTWLRVYYFSRVLMALTPYFLSLIYNAYLTNPGQEPATAPFLCILSFSLIVFLVFDLKETRYIIISVAIMLTAMLFINQINAFLTLDLDSSVMRMGMLPGFITIMCVSVAWGVIWVMAYFNRIANKKSEGLVLKMEDQVMQIQRSEERLKLNIQEIEKTKEEEKRRVWINEGLNKFSEILHSGEDQEKVYDKIIFNIIEYTESNQGALYVVHRDNDDHVKIIHSASYAYNRKKYYEKEIATGQGLMGQAYRDGETIVLSNIPNNYTAITSGVGEKTPDHLLIVPLKINDHVEALLELVSFSAFEEYKVQFLEKLGEAIASVIAGIKTDETTKNLLEKSQLRAEDLHSKEEEMRQNMEELQATQEEMARKEQEYLKKIEELESKIE